MSAPLFQVKDLLAVLDGFAPFALAEQWDNVGLMAGDPGREVSGILVALDPTEEVLAEAAAAGLNVLLTHHPLIFHPLKSIRLNEPLGRLLASTLRQDIAIISCHTNLDVIGSGVSDELAARLGLSNTTPLVETGGRPEGEGIGFGRLGSYSTPVTSEEFLSRVLATLAVPAVQKAGDLPARITKVAVCGGSGSALVEIACRRGAQVFVAGEIKHSDARWAEANDFCVIDAGHFPTENLAVPMLVARVARLLADAGQDLPVQATARQKNPFAHHFAKRI